MPALLAGLLTLFACIPASAQETREPEGPEAAELEGEVHVDPVTGRSYRHARPEEPLRRGALRVDRWVPLAVGGAAAIFAAGALVVAHRHRRKR